jgi:hypothetical protein
MGFEESCDYLGCDYLVRPASFSFEFVEALAIKIKALEDRILELEMPKMNWAPQGAADDIDRARGCTTLAGAFEPRKVTF